MHLTEVKHSGESSFWGNPLETTKGINKGKSRELKKQRVSTKRKSTETTYRENFTNTLINF